MVLESFCHDHSSFVTLTYDDNYLPKDRSLDPIQLKNFLKRLRNYTEKRIRFFGVGEYGDNTFRPHYHLIIYGLSALEYRIIEKAWPFGFVYCGDVNAHSCQYVAGYTVKKMTGKDDPRLEGKHPEFSRMSNRPGIGATAVSVLADTLMTDAGLEDYARRGDVPHELMHGGRKWPLGRYLRQKLREEIGVSDEEQEKIKARFFAESSAALRELLKDSPLIGAETFSERLGKPHRQGALSGEARNKIYNSRKSI